MNRRLTDKPVSRIVNSHWHPDHWSGNAVYTRAFPDVKVMATTATRDYMTRTVHSMRYALRKGLNAHRQSATSGASASDAGATLRIEESLRSIRAMDVVAIVPGHGPVLKDSEYLDLLIELLSQVTVQVEHALETGVLTADLPRALHLESIGSRFRAGTEVRNAHQSVHASARGSACKNRSTS
jgi:glyoxylase-like metal-dependent hydrolase (beta-lactamase superfamily II)